MEDKLLAALKRAIAALNTVPNFVTPEGIKSYALLSELDALMGHTPQPDILDLGHLICLDTGCCNGGWLTAFDVKSRHCWQVDERGIGKCG